MAGCETRPTSHTRAIPPLPPDREDGWEEWLARHRLRDPGHDEATAYRRYLTFSRLRFEVVPEHEWHRYFADLLEFEDKLVFGSGHIGLVAEFPFTFHVHDARPIRARPQQFGKEQRAWLREYCQEQCRLGVMRCVHRGIEPDPVFIKGLVLVEGGQSAQSYQACANLVKTNTRITMAAHPAAETGGTMDQLQGCSIYSALDIKAGFHNIPIPAHLQKFAGITTPDGLYCWCRMPFGYNSAPAHF